MTATAVRMGSSYDVHGLGLAVSSRDRGVLDEIDRRLHAFRSGAGPTGELRLEFVSSDDPALLPPEGQSRPVYDTPYGQVHYFAAADALCGRFGGVRLRCDAADGVARLGAAAFVDHDLYLATHPLTTISLMELLERRGRYSLHAACLATQDGRGVLLAGPSGSGKSTLTIALARAGLRFLSDDTVFLRHDAGAARICVLGFPDALGVTQHTAERFPELNRLLEEPPPPGFPKRLRYIDEIFTGSALDACEPRVLIFPEVAPDQASRLSPLDAKEALLRLVPDVLLTQRVATQAHLAAFAALLAQVRCYRLRSGADLQRAAEVIRALL